MTAKKLKQSSTTTTETKAVVIYGIPCTLEKRRCQGGCDKEFWVMPESTAEHARSDCKFVCNVPIDDIPEHIMRRYDQYASPREIDLEKQVHARQLFSKSNPKTKPPKPEKPKPLPREEDPKFIRQLRRWNIAISRARKILDNKSRLPRFREAVATIAGIVVTNKKNFSIKCFSAMVGIDRKTLQNWIHVKCDIVDRMSKHIYDGNFLAARKTRDFLRQNPDSISEIESIFLQESHGCRKPLKEEIPNSEKSTGLSIIVPSGKTKIYRMKIKIKYVS